MRTTVAKMILIVVLVLVSVQVAIYGFADYYYQRAKDAYSVMALSELRYARELKPVIAGVTRSLSLRKTHSDALDFKADLLYQSWWLSPDGQFLHQSSLLKQAVALHLKAYELRKDWSFSAARLALIYSHQSKLDKKFDYWFTQAHRLGIYETSIARSLMTVGLTHWEQLSKQQKALTMDFIRTSIEQKANSAKAMAILLDRYRKRGHVCRSLPNTSRKKSMCEISNK